MEKVIKIGDKSVKLNNNIGWCFIYRNQFGTDIVPTIMPLLAGTLDVIGGLINEVGSTNEVTMKEIGRVIGTEAMRDALIHLSGLELVDFINITWAMAKCADESIAEPMKWARDLEVFPFDTVGPALFELILSGVTSSKNWERLQTMIGGLKPTKDTKELISTQSSSQELSED